MIEGFENYANCSKCSLHRNNIEVVFDFIGNKYYQYGKGILFTS